jgi:hypothetical protein
VIGEQERHESLDPFELKAILDSAKRKKNKTIKLKQANGYFSLLKHFESLPQYNTDKVSNKPIYI